MSQYIHFYVRREDIFINLCEFSRNNYVYKALSDSVVYEKIQPLTIEELREAKEYLEDLIKENKKQIERLQQLNQHITQMNNSISEKMNQICSNIDEIKDLKVDIKDLSCALGHLNFLIHVYWCNDDWMWDTEEKRKQPFLYVGIESSYNPTINDIA